MFAPPTAIYTHGPGWRVVNYHRAGTSTGIDTHTLIIHFQLDITIYLTHYWHKWMNSAYMLVDRQCKLPYYISLLKLNERKRKLKRVGGGARKVNQETLATLGVQNTGRRKTNHNYCFSSAGYKCTSTDGLYTRFEGWCNTKLVSQCVQIDKNATLRVS